MARTKKAALLPKVASPSKKPSVAKKSAAPTKIKAQNSRRGPSPAFMAKAHRGYPFVMATPKFSKSNSSNNNKQEKINKSKPAAVEILPLRNNKKEKKQKKKAAKKKAAAQQQRQQQYASFASQQQQQVQLPPKRKGQGRIPWMAANNDEIVAGSDSTAVIDLTGEHSPPFNVRYSTPKKRGIRLPTDDSDPVLMERFSQELRAFGNYARLTPIELQAREALLNQMHQVALCVFQNSPEINVQDLELQVFGSYACPDVCTFQSDVDCALWGAVFPKLTKTSSGSASTKKKKKVSTTPTTTPPTTENQKLEQKQKWRLALAMMDAENEMTPDGGMLVAAAATCTEHATPATNNNGDVNAVGDDAVIALENVSTGDVGQGNHSEKELVLPEEDNDKDDMPLFVLDRKGVVDLTGNNDNSEPNEQDATQKSSAAATTSVSTQATVTESDASEVDAVEAKSRASEDNNDSSDDTADKLTEGRLRGTSMAAFHARDECSEEPHIFSIASSGSDSDDEEEETDEDDMAVHFFHRATSEASDFSRRKVIDGLQRYFKGLRNSGMTRNIQLISRA